jgi:hypothetical protein
MDNDPQRTTEGMPNTIPRLSVRVTEAVCRWLGEHDVPLDPQIELALVDVVQKALIAEM